MPLLRSISRRLLAPFVRRGHDLARDTAGVTAVEFGLLALPFFTIIFAILETAVVFLAGQVLDSAVEDAGRMVRTGRAQNAGFTITEFRNQLCGLTFGLFDCSKIRIHVSTIGSFGAAAPPPVQDCDEESCEWSEDEAYEAGARRQVVQVAAYYRWPLVVNLPYFTLRNQPDSYRLLAAVTVFRNEPF